MSTDSKTKILDSKPLTCFFVQTGFGTAFTYLTSGVFLSGLVILMGAGDVLTIILMVLSRFATLFIVVIPVLIPERLRLLLLHSPCRHRQP